MSRKIADYHKFMSMLKGYGYRTQIPITHLQFFIARDVGSSEYIMKSFIQNLMRFGFLVDAGPGIFNIADGWDPTKRITPAIKEAEEEAATEADELLEKMGVVEDAPEQPGRVPGDKDHKAHKPKKGA